MSRKLLSLCIFALPACTGGGGSTSSTSSNITTAVPKAEWLDIQTAAGTPVVEQAPAPQPPATCAGGPPAMFAAMSAQVMGGANAPLEGVLGLVTAVTQSPPTVMTPDHAVWALAAPNDPLAHRLDIQRVADDTYHFVLSGEPVGAGDAAWVGLFQGDVHSIDADHGEGDVEVDFAAIHSLDATSDPTGGQILIHFGAAPDARAIDETFSQIVTSAAPQPNDAHYVFNQDANGAAFDFATSTDFDHDGTLETVNVQARFTSDTSGKASTVVSGGSLGSASVGAIECWDNQQRVLFYADDMNANPPAGDPGCCVM